ncbi:glutathione S-transferase family protein [Neisseria perflava]|uniref:glutathione S-transferase family protein n=1 Tax=Neisseria perflava TaxID=33053 RepID=UPI00209DBD12|nr:glutathione S-transferase family protein [Neisseria perflava]MCP1659243.1 glutathione S-transferase [Neisseria perflava]MCP1771715.1 glutathione S-transferase [Neisseria perflava]
MIKLHHLERSRSMRILWLLEEIGVPYELVTYQRDLQTMRAPESLKKIHPLGKSPVLEIDGQTVIESGAMVELLVKHYAPRLAPAADSPEYAEYLQWLHFAESSGMFPLYFRMFGAKMPQPNLLAQFGAGEIAAVFGYLDTQLEGKDFIVGGKLSGADFMLAFTLEFLEMLGGLAQFANLQRYFDGLRQTESWQHAAAIEQKCCTQGFNF